LIDTSENIDFNIFLPTFHILMFEIMLLGINSAVSLFQACCLKSIEILHLELGGICAGGDHALLIKLISAIESNTSNIHF
jgi:hypothetical protein